ncbi:MAG: hypothetical protein AB7Q97_04765 [Gammaproteobacteria bacterium]
MNLHRLSAALRAACLPALLFAAGVAAEPFYEADFAVARDDNIGRAQRAADVFDAALLEINGRAGHAMTTSSGARLSFDATAGYTRNTARSALSRAAITGRAAWRKRLGIDAGAPWLELSAEAGYAGHEDSDIRDGASGAATMVVGRRLGDRLHARAGYRYLWRRAASGAAFDTGEHRLFVDADVRAGQRLVLYATLEGRTGDVVSTASADRSILALARAAETDTALGDPGIRRVAYRLGGHGASAEVGVNLPIDRRWAIDASGLYHATWARGDNRYHGWIAQASLLYRWR